MGGYMYTSLLALHRRVESTGYVQYVRGYVHMHVGVRVRVRGGGSAIPMTPPLPPNALYYHASNFVEFENVRHYHMYSTSH